MACTGSDSEGGGERNGNCDSRSLQNGGFAEGSLQFDHAIRSQEADLEHPAGPDIT